MTNGEHTKYTIRENTTNDVGGCYSVTYSRPSGCGYTASLKAHSLEAAVAEFGELASAYGWDVSDTDLRKLDGRRFRLNVNGQNP